jgi:hypothetical protein
MRLVICVLVACGSPQIAEPPAPTIVWGASDRGLRLGLLRDGDRIDALLENQTSRPLQVIAKAVRIDAVGSASTTEVYDHEGPSHLDHDDTFAMIAAGARFDDWIDLGEKARRVVGAHGGRAIQPGTYLVSAEYNSMTARVGPWWTGVLRAGPITVELR